MRFSLPIWAQVLLITTVFGAAYPLVRSLPGTPCEFLHYEERVREDGTIELCGSDDVIFLNLEELRFPVEVAMDVPETIAVGQPVEATLTFTKENGEPIQASDLAIVHEHLLHLFVIDESLDDYDHIHPEPFGAGWTFSFTPQKAGTYALYTEMVPLKTKRVIVTRQEVDVAGTADEPVADQGQVAEIGPFIFSLDIPDEGVRLNRANDIRIEIKRKDGGQVELEEVMGAYAHTAAFDFGGKGIAHMHPIDDGVYLGTDHPTFGFSFNTNIPGDYRIWTQVRYQGEDVFAPFDIAVR